MTFERAASLEQMKPGVPVSTEVAGRPICLVQVGDEVKAIHDVCSHEDYPLHEGYVFGRSIECALHGSTFELDTGRPEALPAIKPVPVYAVRLEGDDVLVDVDEQLNDAPQPRH